MTLRTSKLIVKVNNSTLLNNISVNFSAGKLTGIIGPNGAGKSTLLRTLAGLQTQQHGNIFLDDKPTHEISKKTLAQTISYLPQSPECHWALTVERVVSLGRFPYQTGRHLNQKDINAIKEACYATDIQHLVERPIHQLSGGEKARVMLARALATQADILLADEPIVSLDPRHQLEIMALLQTIARTGKTIVLVLHELHFVMRYCDELILLDKGLKIDEGDPPSVLTPQNLRSVYGIDSISGQHQNKNWLLPWNPL